MTTAHPYLNQRGMVAVKPILEMAKNLAEMAAANLVNVDYSADKVSTGSAASQDLI